MISHLHHVVITQREGQLHTGQVTDGKKPILWAEPTEVELVTLDTTGVPELG